MKELCLLVKPASSLCQMRCRYCFYADVSDQRQIRSYGRMGEDTALALLRFAAQSRAPRVSFAFQGGEPTLAGLDFYRNFVEHAARILPDRQIAYSIQTNGLALDEAWVRFFREHSFFVGLSVDGWRENHDYHRPDGAGRGTYARAWDAFRRLTGAGVEVNCLTVVTSPVAKRADKLWKEIRRQGWSYLQFIPCLPPLEGGGATCLTAREYGVFLKELFSLYARAIGEGQYIGVRLFDNMVRMAAGQKAEQCGMDGRCSPQFVVEADGGIYPCDFYVLDEWKCGQVGESTPDEILHSPAMQAFLRRDGLRTKTENRLSGGQDGKSGSEAGTGGKTEARPEEKIQRNEGVGREDGTPAERVCPTCPLFGRCGGGCPRYRSLYPDEGGYCPYLDLWETRRTEILAVRKQAFGF